MPNFGKVAIGVRCGSAPDPLFLASWTALIVGGLRPGDKVLPPATELPHHWAANLLAKRFLDETDCDSLLFVDDDMTFERDALLRLRGNTANHTFDIVQGICCAQRRGHPPLVLLRGKHDRHYRLIRPGPRARTVSVAMVGLAFTLVRRSAFAAARKTIPPKKLLFAWGEDGSGEDAWFCRAALAGGAKIGVDTRCVIGHRVRDEVVWDRRAGAAKIITRQDETFMRLLRGK